MEESHRLDLVFNKNILEKAEIKKKGGASEQISTFNKFICWLNNSCFTEQYTETSNYL